MTLRERKLFSSITNVDLEKILRRLSIKIRGIYSKDHLPHHLRDGFYIINLQSSSEGNGTHWCCLLKHGRSNFWFDSFGFEPPENIARIIGQNYYYSSKSIQDYNSEACGYFVIGFIMAMHNDPHIRHYNKFIRLFSNNTERNDLILYNFLYN